MDWPLEDHLHNDWKYILSQRTFVLKISSIIPVTHLETTCDAKNIQFYTALESGT